MKYITPLNTKRQATVNLDKSMTKQEFKNDCDPTLILKKYQATGLLEHANTYQPVFGEQSSMSYHEAKQATAAAESMFQNLPSSIRADFNQNVGEYLDFVADPKNVQDMLDDGIINSSSTPKASKTEETSEIPTPEGDITPEKTE